MTKYLRVLAIVLTFLVVLSGSANALSVNWYDVKLTMDGSERNYRTTAATVGNFLLEQGVSIDPLAVVFPQESTALDSNNITEITITPGFNVFVSIDGATEVLPVKAGTVARELVDTLQAERGASYALAGEPDQELEHGDRIKLGTLHTEDSIMTLPLMFDTEIIFDDQMEIGEEVLIQNGEIGEVQIVSTLTYIGGELARNQVMSENIVKEPVTEIVRQGTKVPLPKVQTNIGMLSYTHSFDMIATAYCSCFRCTGKNPGDPGFGITASGMPAARGVVAVDPTVIPLGTRLFVEGYGEAIAADVGGAIKGNKIDLYHDTLEEAIRYGRRQIRVYVLS